MAENQDFEEVANGATEEMATEVYEEAGDQAQEDEAMQQEGDENGDEKSENIDDRKIFVGGLSHNTTENCLKEYFEKFGEVENAELKVDPASLRSRGFGFVTFKEAAAIAKVLEEKHVLHNKTIDPKPANPRPTKEPKIFVGGVDVNTTEEDLKTHFSTFGKVKEVVLPFDVVKKTRRPYVFVTFETLEGSSAAIAQPKQTIGDKECDVNEATPQQDKMGFRRGFRGGFRGGPRGRGRGRGRGYDYWGYDYYGGDYYNQGYYDYYGDYYGGYGYGYDGNYYGNYGYENYDWNYYNQGYDQSGGAVEQGYEQTQATESTETETTATAEGGQQQSTYGKQRGRGGAQTNYHPYSR